MTEVSGTIVLLVDAMSQSLKLKKIKPMPISAFVGALLVPSWSFESVFNQRPPSPLATATRGYASKPSRLEHRSPSPGPVRWARLALGPILS